MTPLVASSFPDYSGLLPYAVALGAVVLYAGVRLGVRYPKWRRRVLWAFAIWLVACGITAVVVTLSG